MMSTQASTRIPLKVNNFLFIINIRLDNLSIFLLFLDTINCDQQIACTLVEEDISTGQETSHEDIVRADLCCSGGTINQPTSKALLERSERVYGSGTSTQTRYFLSKWYKTFSWLHFCSSKYKAFCFYCMKAAQQNTSVMSSKAEAAFISTGYSNRRKATVRFKEHELSLVHHDAINAHQASQSTSISSLLSSEVRRIKRREETAL